MSRRITAGLILLGGLLLGVLAPGALGNRAPLPLGMAPRPLRAVDRGAIADRWGIRIESLQLTAAGYMLDLRYRVLDAAKAAPLFDRRTRPVLKDERSGAVMAVPDPPKVGPLRSANEPKAGRTYFILFANPGHFIAKHRPVTVTIGRFSVSGLLVG